MELLRPPSIHTRFLGLDHAAIAAAILQEEKTEPIRTERCAGTQCATMMRPSLHPEWVLPLLKALMPEPVRGWKGWWVILRAGDQTSMISHNHRKYREVHVYYPLVPVFGGTAGSLAFEKGGWISPATDLLVSFPGSLKHWVEPHYCGQPRISVSISVNP